MDTSPLTPAAPPTPPNPESGPKKYIRTFEGDMETLKKGGAPDLTPLVARPPSPTPPPPAPALIKKEEPVTPAPTAPKPSPLQTYEHDFSQRMKDTKASRATVLAAEQDAGGAPQPPEEEKSSRKNILYIVAGVVLLLLGGVGSFIVYTRYQEKLQPIMIAPTVSAPIFVNEKEKIEVTKPADILQAITTSVARTLTPNTVRLLYTDFSTTTDRSVFSALQLPAPGALLRNVNTENSMAGVVHAGGSQSPFFILSVASYADTFAGMLSWERTMTRDVSMLYPAYPSPVVNTTSTTSPQVTTTALTALSPTTFTDEIVDNHDVRIYRDQEGRSVLLYGYWNQETLVIARDTAAFLEILARLATSRASN